MFVIAVSGTNGKTTCCRMIARAFENAGQSCLANKAGANLLTGIVAEFAGGAGLLGRPKHKYAVIECDEAAAKSVFPLLRPSIVLLTNVFRDQLDRYGEVMHTLGNLRQAVDQVPEALLCLNAHDSLLCSLQGQVPNPMLFYGVDSPLSGENGSYVPDARFCIRCGAPYAYDYRTYGHLGAFYCPNCGYRRPQPHVSARPAEPEGSESRIALNINGGEFEACLALPGAYNVYNAAAAACALHGAGFSPQEIKSALETVSCGFGRMEKFNIGGGAQMILVKNPVGFTQVLQYIAGMREPFVLVLCLNDKLADGTDISWIWDADFELLSAASDKIAKIYLSGTRAEELLVRLKYAGVSCPEITIVRGYGELTRRLSSEELPIIVVPTYTAMMELRPYLAREAGSKGFWE